MENEKRFLVTSINREAISRSENSLLEQGYFDLVESSRTFRIRITDNEIAEAVFKEGNGFSRPEKSCDIKDLPLARFLLGETSHILEKIRYFPDYPIEDAVLTIDVYEQPLSGIIIAEVEFNDTNVIESPESIIKPVLDTDILHS